MFWIWIRSDGKIKIFWCESQSLRKSHSGFETNRINQSQDTLGPRCKSSISLCNSNWLRNFGFFSLGFFPFIIAFLVGSLDIRPSSTASSIAHFTWWWKSSVVWCSCFRHTHSAASGTKFCQGLWFLTQGQVLPAIDMPSCICSLLQALLHLPYKQKSTAYNIRKIVLCCYL